MQAIRDNAHYILTHREFLDEVQELHREIEAAFPDEQDIPEARTEFENYRREQATRLRSMPVKD